MSAFGLAHQLRLDRHEAKHLIDRYFHSYPEVKDYIQRTQEEACRHGFVRTWWGRTCWIPGANHTNAIVRAAATRQAVNAPLQGTSADIIKRAMILAHQWMNETSFDVSLVLQIHDELIFQVAQDHVPHVIGPLQSIMQSAAPGIPLRVNVTWGPTLDFDSNAQSTAPGDLQHTHSIPLE
jgi:DNA polymerase-1